MIKQNQPNGAEMHEPTRDLDAAYGFECARCHLKIWWSLTNRWVTKRAPASEVCAGAHR
jgi:hypothetical protein